MTTDDNNLTLKSLNAQINYILFEILFMFRNSEILAQTIQTNKKTDEFFISNFHKLYITSIIKLNQMHDVFIIRISERLNTQLNACYSYRDYIIFMYVFFQKLTNYLNRYVSTCIKGYTIKPLFSIVTIII